MSQNLNGTKNITYLSKNVSWRLYSECMIVILSLVQLLENIISYTKYYMFTYFIYYIATVIGT